MKQSSDIFAEKVGKEKKIVEAESSKANIEADKCGAIKTNVESIQS
jgi:predicted polyphosphate/ATP-dependent NAD kinase